MKRKSFRTVLAATALVLLTASTFADAACRYNTCYQTFTRCRLSGTPFATCYAAYEDCLARNGCPIP
ncbi:MAG: hypothetical protein ABL934_01615 [Lysobacteraceae bacterium]